jgi:hypothetical protein
MNIRVALLSFAIALGLSCVARAHPTLVIDGDEFQVTCSEIDGILVRAQRLAEAALAQAADAPCSVDNRSSCAAEWLTYVQMMRLQTILQQAKNRYCPEA